MRCLKRLAGSIIRLRKVFSSVHRWFIQILNRVLLCCLALTHKGPAEAGVLFRKFFPAMRKMGELPFPRTLILDGVVSLFDDPRYRQIYMQASS